MAAVALGLDPVIAVDVADDKLRDGEGVRRHASSSIPRAMTCSPPSKQRPMPRAPTRGRGDRPARRHGQAFESVRAQGGRAVIDRQCHGRRGAADFTRASSITARACSAPGAATAFPTATFPSFAALMASKRIDVARSADPALWARRHQCGARRSRRRARRTARHRHVAVISSLWAISFSASTSTTRMVCYDGVFHRAASDQGLIPPDIGRGKDDVRGYLRKVDREDDWTTLQGSLWRPHASRFTL